MENGSEMMFKQSEATKFQKPMCGVADFRANRSLSQENSMESKQEPDQDSSSKLYDFLKKPTKKLNPDTYSLKMLKIFSQLIEDGTLPQFSIHWPHAATITSSINSLIPRTLESHKAESACSLSQVLETEVPQKYFLSKEQTERIIWK